MTEEQEIWNTIEGYENYAASNKGNIMNIKRKYILKNHKTKSGYLDVRVVKDGRPKSIRTHQLIAIAFLGHTPCGQKLVVNHKDFDKTNNELHNLEVISQRQNSNRKHIKHTSEYTGVFKQKNRRKWTAAITVNCKVIRLGSFDTEIEASEYYENAVLAVNNGTQIIIKDAKEGCSSSYVGVYFDKCRKRWVSYVSINKKQKALGRFITEIEAYNARVDYLKNNTITKKCAI